MLTITRYSEMLQIPTPRACDVQDFHEIMQPGYYFVIPKQWWKKIEKEIEDHELLFKVIKRWGERYLLCTSGLEILSIRFDHPLYWTEKERADREAAGELGEI